MHHHLHVWYSAFLRPSDIAILAGTIRPLLAAVVDKISDRADDSILGKTWTFGKSSLRLLLTKERWNATLALVTVDDDLTTESAKRIRQAKTVDPGRTDSVHWG